jgi:hypothetical protein
MKTLFESKEEAAKKYFYNDNNVGTVKYFENYFANRIFTGDGTYSDNLYSAIRRVAQENGIDAEGYTICSFSDELIDKCGSRERFQEIIRLGYKQHKSELLEHVERTTAATIHEWEALATTLGVGLIENQDSNLFRSFVEAILMPKALENLNFALEHNE